MSASCVLCGSLTVLNHPCRMVVIPDMLKNSPMFKRIDPKNKVRQHPFCLQRLKCTSITHGVFIADEECANGSWWQRQGGRRTGKGKGSSGARQGCIGLQ